MKGHLQTHCNGLQRAATRCNTLQRTATQVAAKAKSMEEDFNALLDHRHIETYL